MFWRVTLVACLFWFARPYVIGQEIVARYPFDGNLEDVENGYDGEPLGTLVYEPFCDNEKGLRILDDGYNGVFLPHEVMDNAYDFTICAYIQFKGYNHNNNLISAANSSLDNEFIIGYNLVPDQFPNGWHFVIHGEKYFFENSASLITDRCYHFAFIRDGNTARLVFDGEVVVDEIEVTGTPLNVSDGGLLVGLDQDCVGGCFQPDQNLDGLVQELIFFKEALTIEEINQTCIDMVSDVTQVPSAKDEIKVYPIPLEKSFGLKVQAIKRLLLLRSFLCGAKKCSLAFWKTKLRSRFRFMCRQGLMC